ncbi:TonB-dependent receptor [Sphingomonas ginsengisoli (ex An et al. 2013)]|uniref:TonB-dependent receptor n=1 Tax=Sphingomonas ginsengisoli (ex An et al. 2013) TaxID=363835 RepID=UPI001FE6859D|nr:TonB-dependent receptor [Sphingomonas ginsengisoli An et al. 2013]
MKKLLLTSCALVAFVPTAAYAQSTGTVDTETRDTVVVTGTRQQQVGGVQSPDTPKAKSVLTQQIISRQNPGQTILDTINVVPGVSFQNNDAYGSSGGTLNIRGFDSSRISLTFDGLPLNDSGNYAIYSNQQLDPELIEEVNVNLGSTDVDSPTASAVGGTVNYRTILPTKDPSARFVGTLGDFRMRRIFGVLHSGEFGPWGTRAFIAASKQTYNNPFNNYGKIDKQQYNARIWQPVGTNGDFISLSGHYNQNRNNFFGSLPLRQDMTRVLTNGSTLPRIVGPNANNRYPTSNDDRDYNINYPCTVAVGRAGVADTPATSTGPNGAADPNSDYASCGTEFDRRYNPSNTGNLRGQSKFTLADGIVLTVDPSYQYVKANGGGTVTANEGLRDINPAGGTASVATCRTTPSSATNTCVPGYLGGTPYFGRDINGDGDTLDTVTVLAPSQTTTHRYGVIAGLRWDLDRNNTFRINYTLDHAKHRQTGEVGLLAPDGEPLDVFPVNGGQQDTTGSILQKRDRVSYAILNQISGEYRGYFFDRNLNVNIGVRAPFFKRDLTNNCFTSSASGFVECFGSNTAAANQAATFNPYTFNTTTGAVTGWAPPGHRVLKYNKVLPNVGVVYHVTPNASLFANYAKGLSVPGTDNLYNAFYFPAGTDQAKPKPETTNSFDFGARFRSRTIQASLSGWYTKFNNRLASAYDPELNATVYRNLGTVTKYGVDGSVAYSPTTDITLYAFGSWNKSKIKDNIQIGRFGTGVNQVNDCDNVPAGAAQIDILRSCAFTAGKRESGSPKYSYGISATGTVLDNLVLGVTAKRTGPRFIFDNNLPVFAGDLPGQTGTTTVFGGKQVFGATAPAYWLVNLDARLKLDQLSPSLKGSYIQFNVYNLFDQFYVGGFGGGLSQSLSTQSRGTPSVTYQTYGNPPFVQIGAPRTASVSLSLSF